MTAPRRRTGEGSIRLRPDGRWELRARIGGNRRSFFGATEKEVLSKLRDVQRAVDEGRSIPPGRLTVAQYLGDWLEGRKPNLSAKTAKSYRQRIDALLPHIGKVGLAKLTPGDVRAAYAALAASSSLSSTSIQLSHGVLHTALRDAERDGLVSRNVASLVTPPRRDTPEYRSLQPEDARELLAAAAGDPLEAFWTLAVTTGARLGELQALKWDDLDLDRRRLQIRRTLAVDGKPIFAPTSTKKNHNRTVWLTEKAATALAAHRERQEAQRLAGREAWTEHGLIFTVGTGNPLDSRNLRNRNFPALLEKAGLPKMRIHDLRHSAASLLLAEGIPVKVVGEMLGHSDVSTTLRIYAHTLEGAQAQATAYLDRLFNA